MVFGKILKILQTPRIYSEAATEIWGEDAGIKLTPASFISLKPGDIITFSYNGKFAARRSLVVGTSVSPDGQFISSRSNLLLCSFEVDDTLPSLVNLFQSFYNNRSIRYDKLKGTLSQVFGLKNYKTFNMEKMSGIYKIQVVEPT